MVTSKKCVIDINVLQRNDPVLSPIIQNLEQNEEIQYKSYILKANILFHITENDRHGITKLCLVVPDTLKQDVLQPCENHQSSFNSHAYC